MTPVRAHIFLATSVACEAQVSLYNGRFAHNAPASPMAQSTRVPLDRIGKRLWVGLVPVDIPTGFSTTTPISYDLVLHEGSSASNLFDLGLLGGTQSQVGSQWDAHRAAVPLGYEDGMLPSFVLPANDPGPLRIVHASCRKPHGGGEKEPDALQLIDAVLGQTIRGEQPAADRPQQLILTGDQIYADDVSGGLLAALTEAGNELLGWTEAIPLIDNVLLETLLEPGWRTRFLSIRGIDIKEPPETDEDTDYSANHLLRFGEWVAMYLFAWSDALWRIDSHDDYDLPRPPSALPLERIQQLIDLAETVGLIVVPARAARALQVVDWLDQFQRRTAAVWEETRTKALGYAKAVNVVRRTLANVATYTMFDDHEITDDWYLNRRVRDRLHGVDSPSGPKADVGPRMMRNGLSAYAIFQHWGNCPEDFEPLVAHPVGEPGPGRHGRQLLDKWRYVSSSNRGQLANPSQARSADALLGITPEPSTMPASGVPREDFDRIRWDYAVDFGGHRLIALDTRTWRYYPPGEPMSWASLAPRIPNPPGSAASAGAAELRAVAQAWRTAGQQASVTVMRSFGDVVDDVARIGEAVTGSGAQLVDRVVDLVTHANQFLSQLPGRTALATSELLDPINAAFVAFLLDPTTLRSALSGLPQDEVTERAIDLVRWFAEHDFGVSAQELSLVFDALVDFLETAAVRSTVGMAFSARRAAEHAGTDLWRIFTTTVSTSHASHAGILDAVGIALEQLDDITAATGIDDLASALFRDGSNRLGVGLIDPDALHFMVRDPVANVGPTRPVTLLLSPAPIFGNRLVELAQRAKVVQLIAQGKSGEEELDYEAWSVNVPIMDALFDALRPVRCAVVLSGDVHYAGSSVNDVLLDGRTRSRYIQLTSSAARNSDSMTRGLARLDDLLYDENGTVFMFQADWVSRLEAGGSSLEHLRRLARAEVYSFFESALNAITPRHHWENFVHWLTSSSITLEDVLETGQRVVMAAPNSARAWASEAAWKIYSAVETIQELADDPLLSVFGDFLTCGPALRQELRRFYREIGVDPTAGLTADSTVLRDHRPDRMTPYPAMAARFTASSAAYDVTNDWQRRTVGHANAGFVTLVARSGDLVGLRHELRWYPHDEPPRHTDPPPPRMDWIGTLHEAGWTGFARDLGRRSP